MTAPRFRFSLPMIRSIQDLSERQLQVLDGRCKEGLTNAELAYQLGVREQTVKNHITAIRERLDRASMYQVCFEYGQEHAVDAQRPEQV
jgi:DNA-binding NarL/FixJ family response regulator